MEEIMEERAKQRRTNEQTTLVSFSSLADGDRLEFVHLPFPPSFPPFLEKTTLDAARIRN